MEARLYAEDKPKDCRFCYWYGNKYNPCTLDDCWYLLRPAEKKRTPCTGCPYGMHRPCIVWCTKKCMGQGGIE